MFKFQPNGSAGYKNGSSQAELRATPTRNPDKTRKRCRVNRPSLTMLTLSSLLFFFVHPFLHTSPFTPESALRSLWPLCFVPSTLPHGTEAMSALWSCRKQWKKARRRY